MPTPPLVSVPSRLTELGGYFCASCVGLLVDAGTLVLLNRVCGLPYLLAASVSFCLGGIAVYQLWTRCALGHARQGQPLELAAFVMLGALGLLVNGLVMSATIELTHAPLLIAKGAAALCTFLTNYTVRRRLIFARILGTRTAAEGLGG